MLDFLNKLKGKRTYFVGGVIILVSAVLLVTKFEFYQVPEAVWLILSGLGLGAIRAGISEMSANDNKGWKSYAAAAAIVVLGVLQLLGIYLPQEVTLALEGLGIVGVRAALKKIEEVA